MKKASKFGFINEPVLSRKRENPNYITSDKHFVIKGNTSKREAYYPTTPKEHYRSIYFDILDIMISSIKTLFEQPSFKLFSALESLLLEALYSSEVSEETEKLVSKVYEDEIDVTDLKIEANIL